MTKKEFKNIFNNLELNRKITDQNINFSKGVLKNLNNR